MTRRFPDAPRWWSRLRLFVDLIGLEGCDGKPTTVREAWAIAAAFYGDKAQRAAKP